ncbi:MAG: hypothetical protein Q9208_001851 [Pyrenodesmia sp. 3 TL-2023]
MVSQSADSAPSTPKRQRRAPDSAAGSNAAEEVLQAPSPSSGEGPKSTTRTQAYPSNVSLSAPSQQYYHKDTQTPHEGRPAAPYSHLANNGMYAPGITIAEYKTLCGSVCGQVVPSKLVKGQKPFQPSRRYDFYQKYDKEVLQCIICGTPFHTFKEGEKNFPPCLSKNGNPHGYHVSCFKSLRKCCGKGDS